MLVHTGERPYVCHFPSCGKSFSRSDNFHAHYRTHTKIKNAARKKKSDTRPNVTTGDDPSSSFSLLANHYKPQQQNILTSNCHVASTVAANAAAAVVAVSQQFGSSSVYYNTHLHHHSSSEMIDFTRNNHSNTTFQNYGMLNFDMPKCSSSPPISPVSSAASLSLLNHEISPPDSYQPSPSPNPIYAFPYSVQTDIQYSTTKRSQTSIKSHACPVLQCLRRFKRLEHLKRHMRIHTLERPFACTFPGCQKKFSRSDNLSQHTKTHQKHQEKKRKKKE
ncbi:uncharacterized protein B0P05DRAFT_639736 [Gilbertella persicaria]|uniref:uncharacterized protein n=1 Tax=Gilbertella persicaria TaxID=101096 RepID=UPI00221E7132|nr:uncharacterized protein B0P05DRAFT_639736 [Gilbertella persicaria]KAI8066973.1 hypothetical protein B0P05DRAFT_639736 [Gilbertella persicaria]